MDDLPDELLLRVFQYYSTDGSDMKSILTFGAVCSTWRGICYLRTIDRQASQTLNDIRMQMILPRFSETLSQVTLDIRKSSLSPKSIDLLQRCTHLVRLNVINVGTTDLLPALVRLIPKIPLRDFSLESSNLYPIDPIMYSMAGHSTLKNVSIQAERITVTLFSTLLQMNRGIERLRVGRVVNIGDESILTSTIESYPSLTSLHLNYMQLPHPPILAALRNKRITSLGLSQISHRDVTNIFLTDGGLHHLDHITHLSLDVVRKIDPALPFPLPSSIPLYPSLSHLEYRGPFFSSNVCLVLRDILESSSSLKSLTLIDNRFHSTQFSILLDGLRANQSITSLHVEANDVDLGLLCPLLANNNQLRRVILSDEMRDKDPHVCKLIDTMADINEKLQLLDREGDVKLREKIRRNHTKLKKQIAQMFERL
ncbi:hypothetical protein PROFUN_11644 [Planoprotostelium fungivorum]|uniref:F-box domain-containing protein n=1 Tax=Planoprotostelium fungivorum TaxID=1890364 RepID=A0A2P6N9R4_9EUKA|nr:hypothetical protein PROFUN_11644 [Planoprotostelium fungivorum]